MWKSLRGMEREWLFQTFGIYFIVMGVLAFIDFFLLYGTITLWLSHITLIFIGIGILKKNSKLIAVQLNIILIPAFFWSIDFFYQLIMGQPLFGITNYLFGNFTGSFENFLSLQHISTVPIALIFLIFLGLSKKDLWRWSLIEMYLVFLLSIIFSPAISNFNCVLNPCISFMPLGFINYKILWLVSTFLMIFATNYLIFFFINKIRRIKKPKKIRTNKFKTY